MTATVAGEVRDKVARIKQELRSLLDLLSSTVPSQGSEAAGAKPAADAAEGKASVEGQQVTTPQPNDSPRLWPSASEAPRALEAPGHKSDEELPLLGGAADDSNPRKARRSPRHAPRRPSDAT
jgi:hypothetical protein